MAIRKRQEPQIQTEPISPINQEFRTFTEEAIYVINLLKQNGVDIYDSNRYGGMYLNTQKNKNQSIKGLFSDESQSEPNRKVTETETQALTNFFKPKSK